MLEEQEQLYDVIVFNKTTNEIVRIIGKKLSIGGGLRSAESRYRSQCDRLRPNYDIDIVETGLFGKGDLYK